MQCVGLGAWGGLEGAEEGGVKEGGGQHQEETRPWEHQVFYMYVCFPDVTCIQVLSGKTPDNISRNILPYYLQLHTMKISGQPTSSSTRAWAWRQRGCCWYRWGPEIMDSSHPTFSSLALDCLFWVKTTQGRWSFWSRTVILSFGLLVLGRGSWSHGLSVLLPFHSSAGHV